MEQTKSSITTLSGKFFDILKPEEYEYDIEEIATALSNLCRYTGHVNTFYSVAEHSVLVSRIVPERLALAGLLHDASEAYLGDVSSPLKKLLPEYKRIEDRVQRAIEELLDLAKTSIILKYTQPTNECIGRNDSQLPTTESKTLSGTKT
jgi:hypothetical protein